MRNGWLAGILNLVLCLILVFSVVGVVQADDDGKWSNPYLVRTFIDEEGREIAEIIVPGRPPEIRAAVATVPEPNPAMGINVVSNVPAFDWCYGCSATSAAMLFGYYDNSGYSNMYAGPTNGGVCPMDNTGWGQTPWPSIVCGECPLSATHQGIDGQATYGHVDDYWIDYLYPGPDPFIGNWPEHTHGDCTGDYMGTSQSLLGNIDGGTTFFWFTNGDPLYDYTWQEPAKRDGCHGMRLFAESRGYSVITNFNQYIYGYQENERGFTFPDFQVEIDAGRPVLIQVEGHTMLGYGYDTTGQTIYIHDTWDHSDHQMTWGGTYGDDNLQHYGVTVIPLEPASISSPTVTTNAATSVEETTATLNGMVTNDGGEACQYRFQYDTNSGEPYAHHTAWTGSKTSGQSFNAAISSLSKGTKYYFRAQAKNSAGTSSGSELSFLTKPDAPTSFSATTAGTTQIDLSWTKGAGAQKTKIQRKQGGYPANKDDGTQVYFGTATGKSDTGLVPSTTYYYRAWSEVSGSQQWSDNYAQDSATTTSIGAPTVTTNAATSVEETTATPNGTVTNDGGEACQYRFEYDTNSGEPYAHDTGWTGSKTSGQSFSEAISGLNKGTKYYFRAQAENSAGTSSGSELTFLTKPDAPTSFDASTASTTQIDLSWTKGDGAQKTKIQRKEGSYPANRNDGTEVYFGTGTSKSDTGLTPNTIYYYCAWSYAQGSEQWSDNYAQDSATTATGGDAPSVGIEPGTQEVRAGETFEINVVVDAADYVLMGIDVEVSYDSEAMSTSEAQVTKHNLLGGMEIGPTAKDGKVGYALVNTTPQAGVSGSVMTIEFSIAENASVSYHLTITKADLANENGEIISGVVTNGGMVTVVTGRKGDFNGDGDINIFDFVLFAAAYGSELGDDNYNAIGDFNDDGVINIFDFVNFAAVYGT